MKWCGGPKAACPSPPPPKRSSTRASSSARAPSGSTRMSTRIGCRRWTADRSTRARRPKTRRRSPSGKSAFPLARFHDECHLAAWLVEALRDLDSDDPLAAAAVVCRSPLEAAQLARVLRMGLPVHLALEGAFRFGPGAQVTCVPEVKGLEFDHVVVPDVAAGRHADTPEARRALYVAATRAWSQLLLAAAGQPSPLIG